MGNRASRLTEGEEHKLSRKCRALSLAHGRCLKANPDSPGSCANLETTLVQCYAGEIKRCSAAAEAHNRCFMSLMNTGSFRGRRDCEAEVEALRACLKQHKLWPFPHVTT